MDSSVQLLTELAICLVLSAIAAGALFRPLQRLLDELCGTRSRANFWVIYSTVMLFIVPLLTVLMFGKSGRPVVVPFELYKTAFGSALFGLFCALVVIGLQIVKFLPKQEAKAGAQSTASNSDGSRAPPAAAE